MAILINNNKLGRYRPLKHHRSIATDDGRKDDMTEFYENLQQTLNKSNRTGHIMICAGVNARVGNLPIPGVVVGTFRESNK